MVPRAVSRIAALAQISNGLMRAAELHAVDLGSRGLASHVGSDGNGPLERVALCGQWLFDGRGEEASDDKLAENLSFGGRSADEHVYITIVDDGVRSRQHRNNVIDPQLYVPCAPRDGRRPWPARPRASVAFRSLFRHGPMWMGSDGAQTLRVHHHRPPDAMAGA